MTLKSWTLLAAGVAGGLALGVTGYASATGSPSPAPSQNPKAGQAPAPGDGHAFRKGPGGGRPGGGFERGNGPGGRGGGLVTAISSSSITVRTLAGDTRTAALNGSTTYFEGQTKAARSDVNVGEIVFLRLADPKATKPVANSVIVVPAHLGGFVTKIGDGTITVTDESGFTRTIKTSSTTTYEKDGATGKLSDITVGALVRAVGEVDADGTTLDATRVRVGKPAGPQDHPGPRSSAQPGSLEPPPPGPPGEGLDG